MKKHKILSLLLALVLAFSAAGTVFAAPSTWGTPYGLLSGHCSYLAATSKVAVTTTLQRNSMLGDILLEDGILFSYLEPEASSSKIIATGPVNDTSFTYEFPVYSALGSTPIGATCYHTLYSYDSSANRKTFVYEGTTNVSF